MLPKKIIIFGATIIVLGAASVFLIFKGRPRIPSSNPLEKIEAEQIAKVFLEHHGSSTTLSKIEANWFVTEPVHDVTDPLAIQGLLGILKGFSVGSVISTNPNNHPKFSLDKDNAGHIQVFTLGQEKPVLDMYTGKQATGRNDCYMRFEAGDEVLIASNMPFYSFLRTSKDFRDPRLFSSDLFQADSISIINNKRAWTLLRSSETWTLDKAATLVHPVVVKGLVEKLKNIRADNYDDGPEDLLMSGWGSPFMDITVKFSSGQSRVLIGNTKMSTTPGGVTGPVRYAKIEGREAVLLIPADGIQTFFVELEKIR